MNSETIKLIAIAQLVTACTVWYKDETIKLFTAPGCTLFVASLEGNKVTMKMNDTKYLEWKLYCGTYWKEFENRTFLDIRKEYEKKLLDEKEVLEDMGCDY